MNSHSIPLDAARLLPRWRRPITLLAIMAVAMPLAFSTWMALLNNFVVEVAQFDGKDIGWLQSVREIPGFMAVGVIVVLWYMREQVLAVVALLTLGIAVGVTAWFPTFTGLLVTTLISSIGFHYYETVKQSLELQWIDKARAPKVLGWMVAIGSAASLFAYGAIILLWKVMGWDYKSIYLASGSLTIVLALYCWVAFPTIQGPVVQNKKMVLRRRYWLYYALQLMAGARRQIFIVFAAFMMVEHFGFQVHEITALFLINYLANIFFAPLMGNLVHKIGERNTLIFEYLGLILVFSAYGGIYFFGWGVVLGATLYIIDHMFFALAFALKTYFQKIADPADMAPTAAVAFSINHIGAVFLPALLGYLWLVSPGAVFIVATSFAVISLVLALLMPRHPEPGHETIFHRKPLVQADA